MIQKQDDLFDPVRHTFSQTPRAHLGVDTSELAAKSLKPSVAVQRRILKAIIAAGEFGMNYDEVVRSLRMEKPTVAGRLNDLHNAKFIRDSGVRRNTTSGRPARVYVATQEGIDACK